MKKILLFIVPAISIFMLYQIGREINLQRQDQKLYVSIVKQKTSLVSLTQTYFMMRIETLQMISSASSPMVKKNSEKYRQIFNYDMEKIIDSLTANIKDNEERVVFNKMMEKLGEIKEAIDQSSLRAASKSIDDMLDRRIPFREANEAYGNFLSKKLSRITVEVTEHQNTIERLVKILAILQFISFAYGIYYVRSVRSKV